jgi:hypothetical protein
VKVSWWIGLAAATLLAQNGGLAPRPNAADYPARTTIKSATVAAALVAPEQVRKIFAADLSHAGYVVFEVAIYPEQNRPLDLTPADFMLRVPPDGSTMRPAEPAVVAAATIPYDKHTSNPPSLPGKVQVYTETTIGYESGGPYRRGGVYTGGGVGVGVGDHPVPPPPPPSSPKSKDQARDELEALLSAKALPAGRIAQPVAGYLYFPKPSSKHKIDRYELTWLAEETARLTVKVTN